ncbi:MAG: 50S ribosomal protein L18 [Candidatus Aenigmarchaeota archaeon]|nr:50S ribosomal protein L18 [Candidatus Aenigmarchaeota archaeon]
MRRSKKRVIPHRRKREGKTDYRLRLRLLKSGKPRLVVRKSLNNMVCQIVKYERDGDKTFVTAHSEELKKFGWKFHGGNIPSAYLTGLLCAEKAKKHKINRVVLDIGLYSSTPGNRLYSALKGALDGGLDVPHSENILPKPERIAGKHVAAYNAKLKGMPEIFEKTKSNILKGRAERKKTVKAKKTSSKKKK